MPRRAREARKRFDELEEEVDKALEAYLVYLYKSAVKYRELAESGATAEALKEVQQADEIESQQRLEAIHAKMTEWRRVNEEVKMTSVEASVEGTKLRCDAVKQQATFSAAALAGVAAITEGILPERLGYLYLLWVAYGTLLLTIVVSLYLLYVESVRVEYVVRTGQRVPEDSKFWQFFPALYLSAFGLPTAIVLFLIFAGLNL